MNLLKSGVVAALVLCTASCASNGSWGGNGLADGIVTVDEYYGVHPVDLLTVDQYYATHHVDLITVDDHYANSRPAPMDPGRKVTEQDCTKPYTPDGSNLRCQ